MSQPPPRPVSISPPATPLKIAGAVEDRLFADTSRKPEDFKFDTKTVIVFDDMVSRSVPMYDEFQRLIGELASDFAVPGTRLFDLGCSTGTTLAVLDELLPYDVEFVGIDNSEAMLARAREKLSHRFEKRTIDLQLKDLDCERVVHNASVVVMNLTLQFVRPMHRERVLRWIFEGLSDNGCLLMVEKQTFSSSLLNRLFIDHYYAFKRRNGYSDIEISQKREALENVLIPYRPEENREMLRSVGFKQVEEFGRWYNFAGIIALKSSI